VPVAKGHPGNPIDWDDMWEKFGALTEPVLGRRNETLFALVRDFGIGSTLEDMRAILTVLT